MTKAVLPPYLVLFDGECGLCDRSVQWLLKHDSEGKLRFAPLQGETAGPILARTPNLPSGLDSIIFVEQTVDGERLYWRSRAALRIARHLDGAWKMLSYFRVVPSFLTDIGYRFIAAVRYRIWGRLDACRIPQPGERARFLP